MNTLEQMAFFLPSLWLCAIFLSDLAAAIGGIVWIGGRTLYALAYIHATMSLVTPAGASRDPALFSPFATGTKEAPAVPLASLEDDRGLTARSIANLYLRGVEKLSIAYAFDDVRAKDLTDVVTNDPRPLAFQGPIGGSPFVAQGE